jgi:lipopolysaccharide heptosyltransferase II
MTKDIILKGDERILVVRTDRIGDLVLTTSVFEALKNTYPNLEIDALVSSYASPVLQNNPHLDRVLVYDSTRHRSLFETLRLNKYDLAILVYPRPELAWLAFRAGIPVRIGSAFRWYSFLFTLRIHQHRSRIEKHESEYNLEMLRPLGFQSGRILPKIYLSKSETEAAEALLRDCGLNQNDLKVIIHPGGGRSSLRWPDEKFGELALQLKQRISARILVTGDENEKRFTQKVMQQLNQDAIDLTGKLNLRQLAALISRADLVVTNSTGPLHLAAALGVRTVGLFCPIKTASPVRWGPYGPGHVVLVPPLSSCRCSVEKCRRGNCMDLIKVEDAYQGAELILKGAQTGAKI